MPYIYIVFGKVIGSNGLPSPVVCYGKSRGEHPRRSRVKTLLMTVTDPPCRYCDILIILSKLGMVPSTQHSSCVKIKVNNL